MTPYCAPHCNSHRNILQSESDTDFSSLRSKSIKKFAEFPFTSPEVKSVCVQFVCPAWEERDGSAGFNNRLVGINPRLLLLLCDEEPSLFKPRRVAVMQRVMLRSVPVQHQETSGSAVPKILSVTHYCSATLVWVYYHSYLSAWLK